MRFCKIETAFFCSILILVLFSGSGYAQQEIPLWEGESAPFSKPNALKEYMGPCWDGDCAYDVVVPTLTVFPPDGEGIDKLVLVIPGGGYDVVTTTYEGAEIAEAFASRGIAAAMLKYRLPKPESSDSPEQVPITDLRRALEMLRENQAKYGISASMIGVVGFSAGAHLATVAGLHRNEDPRLNPDFSMLIYGVTKMTDENLQWLEKSLYHRKLTESEIKAETLLEWVDASAPPAFLVHALDDTTCHYTESTLYAEALTRHGVAAEMHLYPTGGHGFGAGRKKGGTSQWLDLAADWLRRLPDQSRAD